MAGLLLALFAGTAGCEDQANCGPGTVEAGGECIPLQVVNCDRPGVRFLNGVCVPDFTEVCGPGTVLSSEGTQCVAAGDVGVIDTGAADAGGQDTGIDLPEEVFEFVPECDDDLEAGERVCVWGQVLNFLTLEPVPGDAEPAITVEVKDLIAAIPNPAVAPLEIAPVGEGGYYTLSGFDAPVTMLFIIGEADPESLQDPGATWQRTLGGLVATDDVRTEYEDQTMYTLPRAAVTGWSTALDEDLDPAGFALIRVVEAVGADLVPLEGATLECGPEGEPCPDVEVHYFADAALTSFKDEGDPTTGPSGMAIMRGQSNLDNCRATAPGFALVQGTPCGTSPFRASVAAIVMQAQ